MMTSGGQRRRVLPGPLSGACQIDNTLSLFGIGDFPAARQQSCHQHRNVPARDCERLGFERILEGAGVAVREPYKWIEVHPCR
jgi:hypothetical protein